MFGTQFVGAIHGRLLTAWSTAGIIGPVVVNYIREFQLAAGVPRESALQHHHVHPVRHAGRGPDRQYAGQAAGRKAVHAGRGGTSAAGKVGGGTGRSVWFLRHWQGWARRQGGARLGGRRNPDPVGRLVTLKSTAALF